ncbi:ABC transporter permease [Herbaspirillum sp. RTI4]|uniref:ABC transporter permease n=1 Tax=Herbaspirillum sp. RTI4 TaxID=3048640 RepID=UPI002AB3B48B|nr:ABC transporter permease [Herbaspirillum sp. RTI4]MDY7577879.1 ABC transporter permease [Herbaspirillum sp. RTI4]MEA9981675.1 ABC transporter permease [Herbaspirillum sp. RTI4]
MLVYIIRRCLQSVIVLAVMSLLVFLSVHAIGNPIDVLISADADQAERARVIAAFGLDQPLWLQYGLFIKNALMGDLGRSFVYSTPALGLILERLPATLELALAAIFLTIVIGLPLGLLAGFRPRGAVNNLIMSLSALGFSLPTFWVGLMMIMFFGVQLGWLPTGGRGTTTTLFGIGFGVFNWDGLKHLLLPAINLALFNIAFMIRLTRAGAQEALLQDYVRFARAKGLSPSRIIGVHVLKNILIPIVTVVGMQFGSIMAFSIVTESIFAWPGVGKLLIDSIRVLDRPVLVAFLSLIAVMFILINLIVDVLYSLLDPRVRFSAAKS